MLRDQSEDRTSDRHSSRTWRLSASSTLLGLTVGVAMLRGPARADDERAPAPTAKSPVTAINEPITPVYVPDGAAGLVAFRPAAVFQRMGMGEAALVILSEFAGDLSELGKTLNVDTSGPGFLKLGFEDVEWATCGIRFGRGKNQDQDNLHALVLSGLTVHTLAPVDWLRFLRQWRLELVEVREGGRIYYQIKGPMQPMLGPHPCFYPLDARTLVLDEEKGIRSLISRTAPSQPAYLSGRDWERASCGLLAVAIDNQNAVFAKQYDLGRPDDAVVLSLFKGVDHWTLGVDEADSIALHVAVACASGEAGAAFTRAFEPLLKQARDAIDHDEPAAASAEYHKLGYRMIKRLLANVRVHHKDRSVDLLTDGFGTLADIASIIEAEAREVREGRVRRQAAADKTKSTK